MLSIWVAKLTTCKHSEVGIFEETGIPLSADGGRISVRQLNKKRNVFHALPESGIYTTEYEGAIYSSVFMKVLT